jgi:hypothetical protein
MKPFLSYHALISVIVELAQGVGLEIPLLFADSQSDDLDIAAVEVGVPVPS